MQIEKIFALVDRKVEAFKFGLTKIHGSLTGNEYYLVEVESIVNGEKYQKGKFTIGCPEKAIESLALELLDYVKNAGAVAPGIKLTQEKPEVAPGIRLAEADEDYEDCEERECGCCDCCDEDEEEDEYGFEEDEEELEEEPEEEEISVKLVLTQEKPATAHNCAYCGAAVAPNFKYCPICGGQQ